MAEYNYRIVNVFAEKRLAGNPLALFEDARGMNAVAVQAPRRLRLSVDEAGKIFVAGRVIERGRRTVSI
jgi:trans-2,3-dihydro-3-hydroxyanthranilate isomerase